jgi:hypothetical protein
MANLEYEPTLSADKVEVFRRWVEIQNARVDARRSRPASALATKSALSGLRRPGRRAIHRALPQSWFM